MTVVASVRDARSGLEPAMAWKSRRAGWTVAPVERDLERPRAAFGPEAGRVEVRRPVRLDHRLGVEDGWRLLH